MTSSSMLKAANQLNQAKSFKLNFHPNMMTLAKEKHKLQNYFNHKLL